jgi:hypothetical protein
MKITKRQVATVAGVAVVGAVGTVAVKQMIGSSLRARIIGTLVVLALHDDYDGPVGNWIYKHL